MSKVLHSGANCRFAGATSLVLSTIRQTATSLPCCQRQGSSSPTWSPRMVRPEASGAEFFAALFKEAADGTCCSSSRRHIEPSGVVAAAQRAVKQSGHGLQVDCPWVSSNNGYSLLLRRAPLATRDGQSVAELMARFERDRESHVG